MNGRTASALVLAASLAFHCAGTRQPDRYILYVHGKAVEDGGRRPSTRFGIYEYDRILETFRSAGFRVLSEQRRRGADASEAAGRIVLRTRALIRSGVPASHITIIGASKGAVITMLASTQLQNPDVRYVLLGNCNDTVFDRFDIRLSGRVLSIFERSDEFGGSCARFFGRAGDLRAHGEIPLNLGISHAFLYTPRAEWVGPATEWARTGSVATH
jgi:hypothetical protein